MNLTAQQWNQIGAANSERGQFGPAVHAFRRGLMLEPNHHNMRTNLADNLRRSWQFDEALVEIQVVMGKERSDHAQFVLGLIYLDMGLSDKALRYLTPQLCTTPYAMFCRAQALLHAGKYREGWEWNEGRREMNPMPNPLPLWNGEDLAGKRILIHHEEGFGDTIAYSRWLEALPPESVIVGVPSALTRLMAASFPVAVMNTNEPLPQADYYLPLMRLPHVLGITDVSPQKPYICPLGAFDVPVDPDTRLKVGLVWRSKAGHHSADNLAVNIHGQQKSIPLELLLPLGDLPGVTLYSLQTDCRDIQDLGADYLIYDLGRKINDFNDLGLFMQEMDYVISVDTAPLHLAGAMGVDAIGLLSCRGGWPYPGLGETTPWYESVDLIRQPTPGDWKGAVEDLTRHLAGEQFMEAAQ